jgi:hypothetical protein
MLFRIACPGCGHEGLVSSLPADVIGAAVMVARIEPMRLLIIALTAMLLIAGSARAEEDTPDNPHCPSVCDTKVFGRWIFQSELTCEPPAPSPATCKRHWTIKTTIVEGSTISIHCSHNQYDLLLLPALRWRLTPGSRLRIVIVPVGRNGWLQWKAPVDDKFLFHTELNDNLLDAVQRSETIQFISEYQEFPLGLYTADGIYEAMAALKMACS